uniref:Uncharacterized protein n=1 Tax=Brassica oleracea var. oleracea TaxID=109376 RepID=A0A0D3DRX7_BRAOL
MFLSSRQSRSRRPRRNRSPDEPARAPAIIAIRVREVDAPPPEIASAVLHRLAVAVLCRRPLSLSIWSLFEKLEFIDTTFLLLSIVFGRQTWSLPVASGAEVCTCTLELGGYGGFNSIHVVFSRSINRPRAVCMGTNPLGNVSVDQIAQEFISSSVIVLRLSRSGRDVSAATQVQAVVPRVLLREIMCKLQFGYRIPSGKDNQVTNVLGRHLSNVSGTMEVHELLGHLLVLDCVPLLSRERHMALWLGAGSFAIEDTPCAG